MKWNGFWTTSIAKPMKATVPTWIRGVARTKDQAPQGSLETDFSKEVAWSQEETPDSPRAEWTSWDASTISKIESVI